MLRLQGHVSITAVRVSNGHLLAVIDDRTLLHQSLATNNKHVGQFPCISLGSEECRHVPWSTAKLVNREA